MAEKSDPLDKPPQFQQMAQDALTRALAKQKAKAIAPDMAQQVMDRIKPQGSFKKGGKVKKTGNYTLHKGERVIPAHKADKQSKRDIAMLKRTKYR